jgi:hypothetical protein
MWYCFNILDIKNNIRRGTMQEKNKKNKTRRNQNARSRSLYPDTLMENEVDKNRFKAIIGRP